MGLFSRNKTGVKHAFVLDIGSGSVLAAIVRSQPEADAPDIIWSKREHSPLRTSQSDTDKAKSVMSALMNALMAFDGEGRRALKEKTGENTIHELQVTIAAPWSYTVTKTITYENPEPFTVSEEMIEELVRTANQKVEEEMLENEKVHDLGLEIINKVLLGVVANGYKIEVTGKQKASDVKVTQVTAVAQEYLTKAIEDAKDKLARSSDLYHSSFMLALYSVMAKYNYPETEFCLVDITYEATEIGLVRNGIMTYCTHVPYGSFTLARELSEKLKIPAEEAFGLIASEDLNDMLSKVDENKKETVKEILENYRELLSKLFRETGDSLAIPKKIYLHGNLFTEVFFNGQVLKAAETSTKTHHTVYNITSELLTKSYTPEVKLGITQSGQDTALLVSAQFFHTRAQVGKFVRP